MPRAKIIGNSHYLGVRIEHDDWIDLKFHASSTQDSVGKLVRKMIDEFLKANKDKIL